MTDSSRKVVLITGASSGIGSACAHHLARKGFRIYGTGRAGTSLHDLPENLVMKEMDVTDELSVRTGIEDILAREGRIDVLVNCAGIGIASSLEYTTIEESRKIFDVNFFGYLRICQAVLPAMRRQRFGLIVNISSLLGVMSLPFQGIYCATKHAVEGMSASLSMEVKPFGIRVVLIQPGDFKSNFTKNRLIPAVSQETTEYARNFQRAKDVLEAEELNGPDPIAIAELLESVIRKESPGLRYKVGKTLQTTGAHLKNFMPDSWFEKLMMYMYGQKVRFF